MASQDGPQATCMVFTHMVAGVIDEAIRNVITVGGSLGHITCPESDLLARCYGKIEAVIDTTSVCACESVHFGRAGKNTNSISSTWSASSLRLVLRLRSPLTPPIGGKG